MRWILACSLLAACDPLPSVEPLDETCPATGVTPGGDCTVVASLWCTTAGDTCGLSWGDSSAAPCRCEDGAWRCDDLYPTDGAACAYPDSLSFSCAREGPPGCSLQPSGSWCACAGGAWTCDDTCFEACPATDRPTIDGRDCDFTATCDYAARTCTCDAGHIACVPK